MSKIIIHLKRYSESKPYKTITLHREDITENYKSVVFIKKNYVIQLKTKISELKTCDLLEEEHESSKESIRENERTFVICVNILLETAKMKKKYHLDGSSLIFIKLDLKNLEGNETKKIREMGKKIESLSDDKRDQEESLSTLRKNVDEFSQVVFISAVIVFFVFFAFHQIKFNNLSELRSESNHYQDNLTLKEYLTSDYEIHHLRERQFEMKNNISLIEEKLEMIRKEMPKPLPFCLVRVEDDDSVYYRNLDRWKDFECVYEGEHERVYDQKMCWFKAGNDNYKKARRGDCIIYSE